MNNSNLLALKQAISDFTTRLKNDTGVLISNMYIDNITGELLVDYDNETSDNLGRVVGTDGQPGDNGVSIIDVQLVEDPQQNNDVFLSVTLSNGVKLQPLNSLKGYNGQSITDAYIENNNFVFTLGKTGEILTVPVSGLSPSEIAAVRAEEGALIVTLDDGTELPPVDVAGIATNNPVSASIVAGDLVFVLEDGTEITAGAAANLQGRGVASFVKEDGRLLVTYDDDPLTPVDIGPLDGIASIALTDGNLDITLDSGTVVDLGAFMSFTGAKVVGNELILTTNQPGPAAEINLGPVANLKGDPGVGIKSVEIIDSNFIVTLTDDTELPPLAVSQLTPISVNGARFDSEANKMYLTLTDGTEVDTGIGNDFRGRGVEDVTFNSANGQISIKFDDAVEPVLVGTIPVITNLEITETGELQVTWSNDPTNPVMLTTVKSIVSIETAPSGNVTATFNTGETAALGSIRSVKSSQIVGGQLQITYSDDSTELLGSVIGDKGADGLGIKSAVIDGEGNLVLTRTDDTTLNAGPARTTTKNLIGRTVPWTITQPGEDTFAIPHGGTGTVLPFLNGSTISTDLIDLTVLDTIVYTGTPLAVDDELLFVVYVPAGPDESGRGIFEVTKVSATAYAVTLEDGSEFVIETLTTIPEDTIPPRMVSAGVNAAGDLVLEFDKGDPINAGRANVSINTKNAVVDGNGDLIITLDDDSTINAGSVMSNLAITDATINELGNLIITLNSGSVIDAGITGTYVTTATINENDELVVGLSSGETIVAGSIRNPLLGSRYDYVAFEGQTEFPVAHGDFELMFYANGISLSKDALILTDPSKVVTKKPRKEADIITVLLVSAGNVLATGLQSETDAPNDTYYGKDEEGNVGFHNASRVKFAQPNKFLAEADQTTFNVLHNGLLNVYKNGKLITTGYTLPADNRRVVFDTPLALNDEVMIEVLSAPASSSDLLAGQYARVAYESYSPGGTFASGDWRVRQLNKIVNDSIGIQLLNNRIILPAGQYYVKGTANCSGVLMNAARLFNVTYGQSSVDGAPTFAAQGNSSYDTPETLTPISGYFQVQTQSAIILQHKCVKSVSTYGFGTGNAGGRTSRLDSDLLGIPSRLTDLEIWKVG